jgi:hypothetical protein
MKKFTRRVLVMAAAMALALGLSVAFAVWTATGTGSGQAKATSAQAITASASAVSTDLLYPGKTDGDVGISITNPNPYPIRITSIARSGAITATPLSGRTCTTTGVTFTDQTGLALDLAGGETKSFTLEGVVAMDNTSENGCQDASFTVPVTLTGVSR